MRLCGSKTLPDKVADAIDLLRTLEPPEGYHLAFSGGKDSVVIYRLAQMAGVQFEAHYYLTTVDPPELVWFIKRQYPDVIIDRPKMTMWQLIRKKGMFPTRKIRFCCAKLKEGHGVGSYVITGVRRAESSNRASRKEVSQCFKGKREKTFIRPIVSWSDHDIWSFIRHESIPVSELYAEGFHRLGCVMCPFSNQKRHMQRWPKIAMKYRKMAKELFIGRHSTVFQTDEEYWQWWLSKNSVKETYAYKRSIMDELF